MDSLVGPASYVPGEDRFDPDPPEGYIPAPAETEWTVSSGQVEEKGERCVWLDPSPGLGRIQVSGRIRLLPPVRNSIFRPVNRRLFTVTIFNWTA